MFMCACVLWCAVQAGDPQKAGKLIKQLQEVIQPFGDEKYGAFAEVADLTKHPTCTMRITHTHFSPPRHFLLLKNDCFPNEFDK